MGDHPSLRELVHGFEGPPVQVQKPFVKAIVGGKQGGPANAKPTQKGRPGWILPKLEPAKGSATGAGLCR
jgi:hypothetical protein